MTWKTSLTILLAAGAAFVPATAQEWTRFRGPNGSGASEDRSLPASWTDKEICWKAPLPGRGHGSPVLWGEKVFVLGELNDGEQRSVVCLDAKSGKALWTRRFDAANHRKHRRNSFASSTPAVDSERVYVAWATPKAVTLVALDHAGRKVWKAALGRFRGGHGFAVSPIVYGELVVLPNDQNGKSSLIAVDRRTGRVKWNIARRSQRITYSTPCVYKRADSGRDELIFTNWRHGITAIDPATGKTNWEISVFDQSHKERAIGSPVVAGDLIIGTCGFVTSDKHVVAVRPTAAGKVEEVYRIERAVPHVPTVLVHKDRLYLWSDKGIVSCCHVQTGRQIWQKRVGGNFYGSPVCAAGRLYCVNVQGTVVVLAAGDSFKELARIPLGEACQSTPAIAGGRMFFRTQSHLIAVGGK